jgi:hypothetical protein
VVAVSQIYDKTRIKFFVNSRSRISSFYGNYSSNLLLGSLTQSFCNFKTFLKHRHHLDTSTYIFKPYVQAPPPPQKHIEIEEIIPKPADFLISEEPPLLIHKTKKALSPRSLRMQITKDF